MADIFHEVDEQLRSERLRTGLLRAAPWIGAILAVALAAALGYWGWSHWRQSIDYKASEAYAAGIEALQNGDEKAALGHFKTAADAGSKGYRALSLMQQAGLELRQKKTTEAVALLDQAADVAPSVLIADAARLQAVYALLDTSSRIELEGRLGPLTGADRPYRLQAREALGLARLATGDTKGARETFLVLSQSLDTPDELRSRAQETVSLIDSGLGARTPEVLKAARTLPPELVQRAQAEQAMAAMQAQMAQRAQQQAPQAGTQP